MFQESYSLLLDQLIDHVAQYRPNGVKALVCLAYVLQAEVVEQNLLYNEDGHRLAEFTAGLHDAETKRDDLGGEEKVDDFARVVLDQSTNHAERGQAQVFKRSGF